MFSASTIWFSLLSKAEEVRKNIPNNWSKYEPNPSKMKPGGPLGGGGEVKAAAGGKGTEHPHIFDAHRVAFGAFSVPLMPKWVPFWTPLDFEGGPKWSHFV
jgi:hypothetical protein